MSNKERLYALLKETFLLLDDGDRRLFGKFNLTVSRYYALFHIAQEPGMSLSQLSERMLCDKSNVTRIIKGLEVDGYVVRQPHETDGRTLRLYLTDSGAAIHRQVQLAHKSYNEIRLDCIGEIEQENLTAGLTRLNERLQAALYSPGEAS